MSRFTLVAVLAALVLCGVGAARSADAQQVRAAPGFRAVGVFDQNGFERPIPRFWVNVPQHWSVRGGQTLPNNPCHPGKYQSDWQAVSPDNLYAITFYSDYASLARRANFPLKPIFGRERCPEFYIGDAQAYLTQLAQAHRPNPQLLAYQRRDDLAQLLGVQPSGYDVSGTSSRTWVEIGDLLIRFQMNGQVFEEILRGAVQFERASTTAPTVTGSVSIETYSSEGLVAYSMVAPAGRLNFPFFEYVSSSVTLDPNWLRRLLQVRQAAARRARRAGGASGDGKSVSDIIMEGWRKREGVRDAGHAKYVDSIHEVDNFADPSTGTNWKLPSHYSHAWRMQNGDFVMTDNPLFNPNVDWSSNATRMQRLE